MQQFTNEANIRQFLAENRWPNGLQNALIQSIQRFPVRFMILDDSGSMIEPDGHILVPHVGQFRYVECSRWKELSTAMKFHAQVAHLANARSEFRFLNGASPIVIGEADSFEKIQLLNNLLDQSPGGGTPLCKHIREVIQQIKSIEGALRSNGQKAVVIIATDGESSDGDIAEAMKPLQNLPVWVVIRLCTDSDKIVDYWNNIDSQLELEMDVLDDLNGEAEEVTGNNPWLTYGEPLHRLREWGVHYKEIDLLDESKLSRDQMGSIVNLLLNIDPNRSELPNPSIDWKSYLRVISEANNSELQVWDPINKRMSHWIKINQLNRRYSTSTICSTPSCVIS